MRTRLGRARRALIRSVGRLTGVEAALGRFAETIAREQDRRWQAHTPQLDLHFDLRKQLDTITAVDRQMQILLSLNYRDLVERGRPLPELADVQFRSYSQNGEDGILLYLFALIGTTNKKVVEICAGNGIECNAANLIINHRWIGLLCDGNEEFIEHGRGYYKRNQNTSWLPPRLVHAWITRDNVNDVIRSNGFSGEIDLLSLDMDGVDYWIWQAIDCVQPRVVVLEYNWIWGAERAVTIPYTRDFFNADPGGVGGGIGDRYFGASLPAFVKLGRQKGYRLVGCEGWGFNAFFVRNDAGADLLPEIDAAACFSIPVQQQVRHPKILEAMDPAWEWVAV
jgi:hypothetical protein